MGDRIIEFVKDIWRRVFNPSPPDVFVLGNQKSGTTVIAAALAECAAVSVALDLPAIHTPQMTAAILNHSLTVDRIRRLCRWRFRATVVKEPVLTFYAEELLQSFPNARFVFIVRDPRDNIRSILNRLRLPGHQDVLSAEQWSSIPAAWREVIENRRLGFSFDNYIESLAQRWLHAWQLRSKAVQQIITVRYEDFLADKLGFTRRLTKLAGLQARASVLKSVNRQFQERGDREASWPKFFGDNLALINGICRSAMLELGYDLERSCAKLPGTPTTANYW